MSRSRRWTRFKRHCQVAIRNAIAVGRIRPDAYVAIEVLHDKCCRECGCRGVCRCRLRIGQIEDLGKGPFENVPLIAVRHVYQWRKWMR